LYFVSDVWGWGGFVVDPKSVKRKLSAILSADVQGYSRLMEDEEIATVETITAYVETITSLVYQWKGRIDHAVGDNILAEFSSVVDAVQCAVEIQNVLKTKNQDLPESRRMLFRIGINLGDVIQEGDQIHGDGVNIAARIQSLADGGGICISGTAYDQIETKVALIYRSIGEHSVKNIAKPIRVYKVSTDPEDSEEMIGAVKKKRSKLKWSLTIGTILLVITAGILLGLYWKYLYLPDPKASDLDNQMAFNLPKGPCIAVLPFANINGDPKEDYLSDGITDQIITALSKTPKMLVIARNSVFSYKGKPLIVQQISEELGVRYVLEGSVQKSGDRLRITTQLIDAETGNHLWSERYDRELKDLFAIQDEITMRVIEGLRVKLTEGDQGLIYSTGTDNLQAYLKTLKGGDLAMALRSKDDNALARQMIEEAIALDPAYVNAYVLLAWTHLHDWTYGWTKTPKKSLELGLEIGQKAVFLAESNPNAHSVVEAAYRRLGLLDKALAAGERAIALAPNGAEINALHSATLLRVGRNEEALARINKAIHLNPICPMWYFTVQGYAYRNTGQYEEAVNSYKKAIHLKPEYVTTICGLGEVYRMMGQNEEAISTFKKALQLNPDFHKAHVQLVVTYSLTGQEDRAHAEAKEVIRTNPEFSVHGFDKSYLGGYKRDQRDMIIKALLKAGLPE